MGVWKALVAPTLGGKQLWADVFAADGWCIQSNVFGDRHRLLGPGDRWEVSGTYQECLGAFEAAERAPWSEDDHVVLLLHGYLRTKHAFRRMASRLEAEGYRAVPINYPSMWRGLEENAEALRNVLTHLGSPRRVSLVCHSMGGLIARLVLGTGGAWHQLREVQRLVLLGVPNHGAEMADRLSTSWVYRTVGGPASTQLTTERVPALPLPSVPFGSVAGYRGNGKGWNPLIPGEDDMIVTLDSTRLEGAEDTLDVRVIHTLLMQDAAVIEAVVRYLASGRFGVPDRGVGPRSATCSS